jgi:hypothetical protein
MPTKPKPKFEYTGNRIGPFPELAPGQFIRMHVADAVFHLQREHIPKLIRQKKLPPPTELYPGSRAMGYTSEQINDFRRQSLAASKSTEAA